MRLGRSVASMLAQSSSAKRKGKLPRLKAKSPIMPFASKVVADVLNTLHQSQYPSSTCFFRFSLNSIAYWMGASPRTVAEAKKGFTTCESGLNSCDSKSHKSIERRSRLDLQSAWSTWTTRRTWLAGSLINRRRLAMRFYCHFVVCYELFFLDQIGSDNLIEYFMIWYVDVNCKWCQEFIDRAGLMSLATTLSSTRLLRKCNCGMIFSEPPLAWQCWRGWLCLCMVLAHRLISISKMLDVSN